MRAVAVPGAGANPTLVDVEIPEPVAGEVRVRGGAASLNGFDLSVASGRLVGTMEHRFPAMTAFSHGTLGKIVVTVA